MDATNRSNNSKFQILSKTLQNHSSNKNSKIGHHITMDAMNRSDNSKFQILSKTLQNHSSNEKSKIGT